MELDPAIALQINERLGQLLSILRPAQQEDSGGIQLGIQKATRSSTLYIGESANCPWYRLTEEQKQIPIEEDSIVGYVTGLALRIQHNEKHGDKVKLIIGFDGGKEKFRIVSGVSTVFSRGVLAALLSGDFTKDTLVRFTLKLGDDGKVVLPSVFLAESGQLVFGEKGLVTETNAEERAAEAAEKLGVLFKGLDEPSSGGAASSLVSRGSR